MFSQNIGKKIMYDVIGVGDTFVDVVANVSEDFVKQHGLVKGQGNTLSVRTLREIRKQLMDSRVIPGGAAANSIATLASLGAKCAFIGKACTDTMGEKFKEAFDRAGVHMCVPLVPYDRDADRATPRCLVLVTPDHDRTFAFNMGICEEIDIQDVDVDAIKSSKIMFIEGQMLVSRRARNGVLFALQTAKRAGVKIAFNMHDLNFRAVPVQEVIETIRTQSDILIGNEREVRGCFDINETTDTEAFSSILSNRKQVLVMTRGANGAYIFSENGVDAIPSENHLSIVDSTGAGDAFAAGFLYGVANKMSLVASGKLAALTAAELLRHWGGRPEVNLQEKLHSYIQSVLPR